MAIKSLREHIVALAEENPDKTALVACDESGLTAYLSTLS